MYFQDIITSLAKFWAQKGCVVLPAYDAPMGAGTLAPFTALRCLQPKPWAACYAQGCRRPNDGRYGENPNRLSHYYQFQVIIQPTPSDLQKVYTASLAHLGINTLNHDIRFLEDDWENPSIGAAGLGWEVWLDGSEITQCTFFQQVASIPCSLPAMEITYGLERIAMFLQKTDSIFDIQWNQTTTYKDIFHPQEKELSLFCFDHANVEFLQKCFHGYLQEAHSLLTHNLPICAYDQCLMASQSFNILQARGALSTAERESGISAIRTLVRSVGKLYLNQYHE